MFHVVLLGLTMKLFIFSVLSAFVYKAVLQLPLTLSLQPPVTASPSQQNILIVNFSADCTLCLNILMNAIITHGWLVISILKRRTLFISFLIAETMMLI